MDFGTFVIIGGLVAVFCSVFSLVRGSPWKRNRDKWLLQHFGKDGRKRWLLNEKLAGQFFDLEREHMYQRQGTKSYQKALRATEESMAKYGEDCFKAPHRNSSGGCSGLVIDRMSNDNYSPWGGGAYPSRHAGDPYCHKIQGHFHGEPMGVDWLAGGYWDPVMVDGEEVDPMKVLFDDYVRFWMEKGKPIVLGLADDDERVSQSYREAKRRKGFVDRG